MRLRNLRWFALFAVGWTWLLGASVGRAEDKYYLIMFAFETGPKQPRGAHTFATFVKADENPHIDPARWPIEIHTISWMPASLDVRLLAPPERGVNLDLKATLELAKSRGARVSAWGPLPIKKELYDRALAQIERLNSGTLAYRALDGKDRPKGVTNCIHAVSDIVEGPMLNTDTAYGEPASRIVLQHLSPWIVKPKINVDLAKRLALDGNGVALRNDLPEIVRPEIDKK